MYGCGASSQAWLGLGVIPIFARSHPRRRGSPRGNIRSAGNRIKHPPARQPSTQPARSPPLARPLARPNTALHNRLPTRPLAVPRDGARSMLGKLTRKLRAGWWKPPDRWPNPPGGRSHGRLPARLVACALYSMSARPPTRLPARMPDCSTAVHPHNQPGRWPTRPSARPPALRPARFHHPFPPAHPLARPPARPLPRPNAPPSRNLARSQFSPNAPARSVGSWRDGCELDASAGGKPRGAKAAWNASAAAMLARARHAVVCFVLGERWPVVADASTFLVGHEQACALARYNRQSHNIRGMGKGHRIWHSYSE